MKIKNKIFIKCANCDKTISKNNAKETILVFDFVKNLYKYTIICPNCGCKTCSYLRKEVEEELNDFLQ